MENVLLINRLGIGDVVLTTPLAGLIKEYFGSQVGMVVAQKAVDILINHAWVDDVFSYSQSSKAETVRQIRQQQYTNALIVDGRFSSTLLALKSGCRLKNLGFEISIGTWRPFARKQHTVRADLDYSSCLRYLDPEIPVKEIPPMVGTVDEESYHKINSWLTRHGFNLHPLMLIVPRGLSANKNWPVAALEEFNTLLNQYNITPVYIGSQQDRDFVAALKGKIINAAGYFSLREVAVLAKYASVSVTPCTGTMHVIATAGTPLVALYGPTDPWRWAPKQAIVLQADLQCIPCQKLTCSQTKEQQCMESISPLTVFKTVEPFLSLH